MNERHLRPLLWGAAGVLVLSLIAFLAVGANSPADPVLEPAIDTTPTSGLPSDTPARRPVEGFGEIGFRVGPDSAPAKKFCGLLAETGPQLSQGLMGRSDLSGYDGMIFRFAADTTSSFFMRNVPMPLEIAWFDAEGRLVSTAEMAPCPDRDGCPTYPPAGSFRFALEVEAGGLARLGVHDGATLALDERCAGETA